MQVQVNLTLPVSAEDWHKLTQLQSICSLGSVSIEGLGTLKNKYTKELSTKPKVLDTQEQLSFEDLSEDDKMILDKAAEQTHTSGETPIMDELSGIEIGNKKPSVRSIMVRFMKDNGGFASRSELIDHVLSIRNDMGIMQVSRGLDGASTKMHVIKDYGMWTLPNDV